MSVFNGAQPILEVKNLKTHFFTDKGVVQAVKGVSFQLANKQTLGIVVRLFGSEAALKKSA